MKGRFVIPIFNEQNQLLGYCGYDLKDPTAKPKWPKPEHFTQGVDLFYLGDAMKVSKGETLFVVRDVIDVLHLAELPLRHRVTALGLILQRADRGVRIGRHRSNRRCGPLERGGSARLRCDHRKDGILRVDRGTIESESRARHRNGP